MDNLEGREFVVEEYQAMLQRAVTLLMEHFDSVRVVATKDNGEEDVTHSMTCGAGNWYAQWGSVKGWVLSNERTLSHTSDSEEDDE